MLCAFVVRFTLAVPLLLVVVMVVFCVVPVGVSTVGAMALWCDRVALVCGCGKVDLVR